MQFAAETIIGMELPVVHHKIHCWRSPPHFNSAGLLLLRLHHHFS
ncbi:hypothetical protein SO3561_09049 [Streptomyces olivochromogenes]|uniref:Uncharacterized protein n=1 Tax=Streptomyces olivochromogenes TaxID=1963 RepID=A0A250VTR2_STROL|nr:hypothetical protein SO3561_09049 [Streptomyces olivochromogenes]